MYRVFLPQRVEVDCGSRRRESIMIPNPSSDSLNQRLFPSCLLVSCIKHALIAVPRGGQRMFHFVSTTSSRIPFFQCYLSCGSRVWVLDWDGKERSEKRREIVDTLDRDFDGECMRMEMEVLDFVLRRMGGSK